MGGATRWFTGSVTEPRPVPHDPADLKAWLEGLSSDALLALTEQVGGGVSTDPLMAFGDVDWRNREIDLPPPPGEPNLLTLTIELDGAEPRIWRRLALPGDLTLDTVHTLLQAAMGWSDSHLHRFQPGVGQAFNEPFFVTEFDQDEGDEGTREEAVRLDQVLREPGDGLTYLYDFGDGWEHRVTLESLTALTPATREPVCLSGAGACPPEDVGGIHAHHELATWLRGGTPADAVPDGFEDAAHARSWLPDGYDPDAFDAAGTTALMRVWASGEHLPWHGVPGPLAELLQALRSEGWSQAIDWLNALGPRVAVELDEDDVRRAARPWLAVLDAVGSGTKLTAAGYLPPALVLQIARTAGVMDGWYGPASREDQTWPVLVLRENAQDVGLLRKAKGRLSPTARARSVAGRPRELVAKVLERIPLGKGFDADAGWFTLLGLAAGVSGPALDEGVAQMLTDRGWRIEGSSVVSVRHAHGGSMPTLGALESMAGGHQTADPELVTRLARAALFGVTILR